MQENELDKLIDEIIINIHEFIMAEIKLNFNPSEFTQGQLFTIISIIFTKMFLNSILNTALAIEKSPTYIYESLEIPEKIKILEKGMDKMNKK